MALRLTPSNTKYATGDFNHAVRYRSLWGDTGYEIKRELCRYVDVWFIIRYGCVLYFTRNSTLR